MEGKRGLEEDSRRGMPSAPPREARTSTKFFFCHCMKCSNDVRSSLVIQAKNCLQKLAPKVTSVHRKPLLCGMSASQ